jgi:hypothetical protein
MLVRYTFFFFCAFGFVWYELVKLHPGAASGGCRQTLPFVSTHRLSLRFPAHIKTARYITRLPSTIANARAVYPILYSVGSPCRCWLKSLAVLLLLGFLNRILTALSALV